MGNKIIAKGKVYQYGKIYLDPETGTVGNLQEYSETLEQFRIETPLEYHDCKNLITVEEIAGTIEDAPLTLIEGRWYMCEWSMPGKFIESAVLQCVDGKLGSLEPRGNLEPRGIKPIYEMVRKEDV